MQWSPWLTEGGKKTAILAYVARNYVGFRRVTIEADWSAKTSPAIEIDKNDTKGICLFLSVDAFIKWEDNVGALAAGLNAVDRN